MARVTVEDCVTKIPNRFQLVIIASQRARNISAGAELNVDRDNDKNPVIALREIADDLVDHNELEESLIKGLQKYVEMDDPEDDEVDLIAIQQAYDGETADASTASAPGSKDKDGTEPLPQLPHLGGEQQRDHRDRGAGEHQPAPTAAIEDAPDEERGGGRDHLPRREGDDELRPRPPQLFRHRFEEDAGEIADEAGADDEVGDRGRADDVPAEVDPRAALGRRRRGVGVAHAGTPISGGRLAEGGGDSLRASVRGHRAAPGGL